MKTLKELVNAYDVAVMVERDALNMLTREFSKPTAEQLPEFIEEAKAYAMDAKNMRKSRLAELPSRWCVITINPGRPTMHTLFADCWKDGKAIYEACKASLTEGDSLAWDWYHKQPSAFGVVKAPGMVEYK